MDMTHWIIWALVGWGFATWWVNLVAAALDWLPRPVPGNGDRVSRFISTSIVGIIGGVLGGLILTSLAHSEPMPGLSLDVIGALCGASILMAGLRSFGPK